MYSATFDLACAELALYIVLLFCTSFILYRHGRPGYDAWGFLVVYCILRIVAAALQINDKDSTSLAAAIVNVAGVSGLMLAIAGINFEASRFEPNHNARTSRIIATKFHLLVSLGTVLAAVGGSMLATDAPNEYRTDGTGHALIQAGYAVLVVLIVALFGYSVYMTRKTQRSAQYGSHQGKRLMYAVLFAIPWVGVRVVYGLVASVTELMVLSPYMGVFAVKFVLIFLVQFIACVSLVVGGFLSCGMNAAGRGHGGVESGVTSGSQGVPVGRYGGQEGVVRGSDEQKEEVQQVQYARGRV